MTEAEEKEKQLISRKYLKLIQEYGLKQICRIVDEKTFVARYEFEARMRDLYRTKDGKCSVVWKFDPAPGGYGEAFILVEGMTEPVMVENAMELSEEELLETVSKTGKKIEI